jgi:hypothetical protein
VVIDKAVYERFGLARFYGDPSSKQVLPILTVEDGFQRLKDIGKLSEDAIASQKGAWLLHRLLLLPTQITSTYDECDRL